MKRIETFKWILTVTIIPLLLFLAVGGTDHAVAVSNVDSPTTETGKNMDREIANADPEKLSEKEIKNKTNQFMDLLIQDIDNDNRVKRVDSKKALIQSFKHVADQETAKAFVDRYYEERDDGLYVIPSEKPAWIDEDQDIDVIQLEDNRVKALQHNQSDLYREYTIAIEFTYDNEWVISNVRYSEGQAPRPA